MIRRVAFILLSILLCINGASAFNLESAALCNGDLSTKSPDEIEAIKYISGYYSSIDDPIYSCIGWYSESEKQAIFVKNANELQRFSFESQQPIANWPLTRWHHERIEETITDLFDVYLSKFAVNYDTYLKNPIGCLNETPLRYGDIESDGNNELVLFLGGDLVVFSPATKNIVFSNNMSTDNWLNPVETVQYFEDFGGEGHAKIPQYQWNGVSDLREPVPALRGYGKIYHGDLDEDGNLDILVWRKLYRSYWQNDPTEGFELLSNTFYHYERDLEAQAESEAGITGEYLPQDTSEEDIQNWLAENNLTWSKGYPSKSECPGEEGQLIPEMHDPLLNDPDVLK